MKWTVIVVGFGLLACGAAFGQEDPDTWSRISLHEELVFTAPDGSPVEVAAGSYFVEVTATRNLRLVAKEGGDALLLGATPLKHDEEVENAIALLIGDDEQAAHLLFLDPDGEAAEAVGTVGGVTTRSARRVLSRKQITTSIQMKRARPSYQLQRPQRTDVLAKGLSVDTAITSCPTSTVFLSGWWSIVDETAEIDAIGGQLLVYWLDEHGNACHGIPGTSGQPGPFGLMAYEPAALSASKSYSSVTAAQLDDFQQVSFSMAPYAGDGLHFVQFANLLWRKRADGMAFKSNYHYSIPAVVSVDNGSFCMTAVQTMRSECASSMSLSIPNVFPASGQHPTKCKSRIKPAQISVSLRARQESCVLQLPHGTNIVNP